MQRIIRLVSALVALLVFWTCYNIDFSPDFPLTGSLTGQFLHITDLHIDPHYVADSDPRTGCHRSDFSNKKRPRVEDAIVGKYGAPLSGCDSPLALVNLTLKTLKKEFVESRSLDFVIWTGDNARYKPF